MSARGWAAPAAGAAVLFALSAVLVFFSSASTTTGGVAPSFTVTDIDGDTISLDELRGRVVVLHLTVVYCGGVVTDAGRYQIEQLGEARERWGEGVALVSVTSENCPTTELAAVRKQHNISWPLVNDWPDFRIYGPYANYFSLHGDPTLVFIDPSGRVVGHTGRASAGEILRAVEAARAGSAPASPVTSSIGFAGMLALGALTSLAPCSMALLATMLAFLISRGHEKRSGVVESGRASAVRGLSIGLYFTLGTGLVFLLLGLLVGYLEVFVTLSPAFFAVAGAVLIVLGLNSAFSIFERVRGMVGRGSGGGTGAPGWARAIRRAWGRSPELGALLLGTLFSLAWAPCAISLVLPVIVLVLASKVGLLAGGALLFFFGLGHAVPIIPIAMVTETSRARLAERYMRAGRVVTVVFGLAVSVMGALFIARALGVYLW
ncbi:MAG: cytochrome c biogenesis protein CcdA [Thermoplasmata archaeon]